MQREEIVVSRKLLLLCGLASSVVYLAMDILGSLRWDGYSYIDQTISELGALGAPSRPLAVVLAIIYDVLLIAFAVGVARSSERTRFVRIGAAALAGIGVIGFISAFFPIQMRGAGQWTINESMHVALTSATVVLIVASMAFSSKVAGHRFFAYSMISIAVTFVFGALGGWMGRGIGENLPTPWVGVIERISVFAFLAWVAVLAAMLMHAPPARRTAFPDDMLPR
jgi:hypothetical protein